MLVKEGDLLVKICVIDEKTGLYINLMANVLIVHQECKPVFR